MTRIRTILTAAAFGLIAVPALAGGISINLPRLEFPSDDGGATRTCQTVTTPGCVTDGQ